MSNLFIKNLVGPETKDKFSYAAERTIYLCKVLIISYMFNYIWNTITNTYFDGANEMSLFESIIILLCII